VPRGGAVAGGDGCLLVSIEKIGRALIQAYGGLWGPMPLGRSRSPSGLGHFSAQDGPGPPTEGPRVAKDRLQRPQGQPRTAHRGPKGRLGSPTEAPGATHDHPQRLQGSPRTAYRGPRDNPGPPTEALRVAQDRRQGPQGQPKAAHTGQARHHHD